MARFTSPSTWGRSKHSNQKHQTNHPDTSTASLNQSSFHSNPYVNPTPSTSYATSSSTHHPYAANPPAPVPVVAHDVNESDETCPVCLESLAFSFRLPGEKPHIVPECGHALHEACFTTVYGPVPNAAGRAAGGPRKSHIGVCGVCRRPMKVGDGDGGKSNKLAALTGMGGSEDRSSSYGPSSSPIPSVIVGPNRPPGSTLGHQSTVPSRLPNGQTPVSGSVVVLGNVGYAPPKNSMSGSIVGASASSSPTFSNTYSKSALIDAHPSGASYTATPPVSALAPGIAGKPYDPNEDDPLEYSPSMRSGSSGDPNGNSTYIVAPSIQVRSEFPTITPTVASGTPGNANDGRMQPLTCIVVVELASRRTGPVPGQQGSTTASIIEPYLLSSEGRPFSSGTATTNGTGTVTHTQGHQSTSSIVGSMRTAPTHITHHNQHEDAEFGRRAPEPPLPRYNPHHQSVQSQAQTQSSQHNAAPSQDDADHNASANGVKSPSSSKPSPLMRDPDAPNPAFASVAQDLQNRIADWKGHPMSGLGALQMFDILSVRRDALVREFYVYLFKEAIICVLEDKKKNQNALGRLLSASGASTSGSPYGGGGSETASLASNQTNSNKPVLRLKGRIYIRHIKRVHDTSTTTELSLTIDMEDERLESFILIFRDRTTLEGWRSVINGLVETLREGSVAGRTKSRERLGNGNAGLAANAVGGRDGRRSPGPPPPAPSHHKTALLNEMEEFGGSLAGGKAGR
ncbi:hypothetical protein FRB99_007488, partial [Tulasnella sp. 403]